MLPRMDNPMHSWSLRLRPLKQHARRPTIIAVMVVYLIVAAMLAAKIFPARHIADLSAQPLTRFMPIRPTRLRSRATKANCETMKLAGEPEIWARGPIRMSSAVVLRDLLDADVTKQLRSLCGRCLYRTLTSYVRAQDHGRFTVVLTGDISAVWLRDSAVQMATYLPRVARRPAIRQMLDGAIRAQAYFMLQDPWANAYNAEYIPPDSLPKNDRLLGRGGWVFTRNFELAVEQLLGVDCDEAAEEHRLHEIKMREQRDTGAPANGGRDLTAYYEQLEASVKHT